MNFRFYPALLVFLLGYATQLTAQASHKRKVLILGIDGCRVDALLKANTPTLDSLRQHGIFCSTSWHLGKTKSGPGWFEVESDTIVEKYIRLHLQGILAYQISLVSHGNN